MIPSEPEAESSRQQRWLPWRWPRGGMQVLAEGEAQVLSDRLREKVRISFPQDPGREERPEAFDDWLRLRFQVPLERDALAGPAFGKSATALGVATIGAGLASSAITTASGGDWATVVVASLGIIVGVLATINQIWRPSERSVARYQAAFALRREGWAYLQDRGRYERVAPEDRLPAFIDEVTRIHRAVELVDEATSASQTGG